MIERYRDPIIAELFERNTRIMLWAKIELAYIQARAMSGEDITPEQIRRIANTKVPTAEQVDRHEHDTGHDVVAFLDLWTDRMDDDIAHLVHRGLTSSDVVDTAHFMALASTAQMVVNHLIELASALDSKDDDTNKYHRIGRTHGQYAEPTTMEHRMQVWQYSIQCAVNRLSVVVDECATLKSPGATGNGWFFDPRTVGQAAKALGLPTITISTQVIPRTRQVAWAAALLEAVTICEDIAMEIRLSSRSEVAEFKEGATRVGSSAMPGKHNPIGAENICGLARLARGYFTALAESAVLHNDRDISNSSVERVAAEDLAHVASFAVHRTLHLIQNLEFDQAQMKATLHMNRKVALASTYQYLVQKHFKVRAVDASKAVAEWMHQDRGYDELFNIVDPTRDLNRTDERLDAFTADLMMYESMMGL